MYLQPAWEEKRYPREIQFLMSQIVTHGTTVGWDAPSPVREAKTWAGARQKKTSALAKARPQKECAGEREREGGRRGGEFHLNSSSLWSAINIPTRRVTWALWGQGGRRWKKGEWSERLVRLSRVNPPKKPTKQCGKAPNNQDLKRIISGTPLVRINAIIL